MMPLLMENYKNTSTAACQEEDPPEEKGHRFLHTTLDSGCSRTRHTTFCEGVLLYVCRYLVLNNRSYDHQPARKGFFQNGCISLECYTLLNVGKVFSV